MKYIRTKDGHICEIVEGIMLATYPAMYLLKNGANVSTRDVVGAADKVEKLFDWIEARRPQPNCKCNYDELVIEPKDYLNGDKRCMALLSEGYTVYGVTEEWGVINYVTKLTDKGEWELLSDPRFGKSIVAGMTPGQKEGARDFDKEKLDLRLKIASLRAKCERQSAVLRILKRHARKISEVPGQEKEPDILIIVMPEADEEYETAIKWLEEEE